MAGASVRPLSFTVRRPMARASLFFAAGLWGAVVLIGAVAIYGFDYFERALGRGVSLEVYIWVATLGAIASPFPAGFGFRLGSRDGIAPRPLLATICGAAAVLLFWLIAFLVPDHSPSGPTFWVLLAVTPFCTAYLGSVIKNRLAAGPSNNRWRGP